MITETETAFLAVIRAFLTEEKASPAEIQGLTEKQWNHLFVLAAQHSLLSAVYDVVGKTPEFAELPDECIFRKNCASVPEERSAIPLQTEQSSAG